MLVEVLYVCAVTAVLLLVLIIFRFSSVCYLMLSEQVVFCHFVRGFFHNCLIVCAYVFVYVCVCECASAKCKYPTKNIDIGGDFQFFFQFHLSFGNLLSKKCAPRSNQS